MMSFFFFNSRFRASEIVICIAVLTDFDSFFTRFIYLFALSEINGAAVVISFFPRFLPPKNI
jgi:hypothetical protein